MAESLAKSFEGTNVLDGVSFDVDAGEIFGFLGPNGAGKSTTMMILTTLIKPTSGKASVAGHDVVEQPHRVRENIGYVQHDAVSDEYLTGRENLILHARLNHTESSVINRRVDEMLEIIGLAGRQHDAVASYSAGMKKRLDIAAGMLHLPKVLFLDEPTVGLDIQTRHKIWEYVKKIHREYDMSIFLSTHHMEEAEALCGRVGIIDSGNICAIDTPQALRDALCPEMIRITAGHIPESFVAQVRQIPDVARATVHDGHIAIEASGGSRIIPRIFAISNMHNVKIDSFSLARPTLNDVLVSHTGRNINASQSSKPAPQGRDMTEEAGDGGIGTPGGTGGRSEEGL